MKTLRIFLIFLLCGSIGSWLQGQSANVTMGCAPLEVTFSADNNFPTYFWDFQDGGISEIENPSHIFANPGEYEVELRQTENGPAEGTITISVFEQPDVTAIATPDGGCVPLDVVFESTSTVDSRITVTGYQWVFGDGNGSNAGAMVSHTYAGPGNYTVSLSLETNFASCNTQEIFNDFVTVSDPPDVGFTTDPDPAIACVGPITVSFTNTSTATTALSYDWDFGNGMTSNAETPPSQTYTADGQYPVTLTATDASGCSQSFTRIVSVGPPNASFSLPKDTVCLEEAVQMENNSSDGNYIWNFGASATPQGSTQANPVVIFSEAGSFDISLSVTSTDGNCSADTVVTIVVEEADASFTSDPTFSCSEPMLVNFTPNNPLAGQTYQWDFDDESLPSNESNPSHEYNNPDTTTFSINGAIVFHPELTVTTASGCIATFADTIVLHQPNALFQPDVINGCAPLTVTFSDSSSSVEQILFWQWDFGDGGTAVENNDDPVVHTFTSPGEYDVTLIITNSSNCADTSYALTIEVGSQITPAFSADQSSVCPGDTVTFIDETGQDDLIDAWHFSTDNGRSFHCFDENSLMWPYTSETGPQDVSLTVEYNGCYSTTSISNLIDVNGPIAQIDYLVDCENPFDIAFMNESFDDTSISWDFGDITMISNDQDPVHTYDTTGDYTVILTAQNSINGCPASMDTVIVHVRDIEAGFELDTILCLGQEYQLDAAMSQDVEADCWRGYTWYFDSARPITTQDESIDFTFMRPGDDIVTLVTTDINGCRDTSVLDVRIFGVYPDVTPSQDTICLPATVSFTNLTTADTTIVEWEWDFGDGSGTMSSDSLPPPYTFTSIVSNPIDVTLTATDAVGCGQMATIPISVYQPFSEITTIPNPAAICVGEEVSFTASDFTTFGSSLTYEWDFGSGMPTTSTMQTETVTFDTPGNIEIDLVFTEVASGCKDSVRTFIDVQDFPVADFTSDLDDIMGNICYPQDPQFTDLSVSSSPLTQSWDFGNGQMGMGPTPFASFGKGTFEVTLTVTTTNGCASTTSRTYTLIGPEGDFEIDRNEICNGDDITFSLIEADTSGVSSFSWDFGDGTVMEGGNPVTHEYNFSDTTSTTIVQLILEGDGCTIPIEKDISIIQLFADFVIGDGTSNTACVGDNVDFFNNTLGSADLFSWDFDDGTMSTQENPANIFNDPGDYEIEFAVGTSQLGCTDTISQTLIISDIPALSADDTGVCPEEAATVSVDNPDPNSVYSWTPEEVFASGTNSSTATTSILTENTTVFVEVTNELGCTNTDTVSISVVQAYEPVIFDTTVCEGTTIALPLLKDTTHAFSWSTTEGLSCTDCSFPTVEVLQGVQYILTVTDAFGLNCFSVIDSFTLRIPEGDLEMPNAFTPNGDGNNDFFNYVLTGASGDEILVEQFQIFNRWGQVVYDNEDPSVGWDGMFKGKPSPSDTYVYLIKVALVGCPIGESNGDLILIR
ncbi:MAG: PKD domain-containing protein [Bacteroidota bacterium]